MANYYKNSEGYSDPTAGAALGNIQKEEKERKRRRIRRKKRHINTRRNVSGNNDGRRLNGTL